MSDDEKCWQGTEAPAPDEVAGTSLHALHMYKKIRDKLYEKQHPRLDIMQQETVVLVGQETNEGGLMLVPTPCLPGCSAGSGDPGRVQREGESWQGKVARVHRAESWRGKSCVEKEPQRPAEGPSSSRLQLTTDQSKSEKEPPKDGEEPPRRMGVHRAGKMSASNSQY